MNATTVSEFEDARALCGAASLAGDKPAGADVRGGADFETLETEVRRMDADGPAAVDWRKVTSLSLQILSSQSKDILVASWATYGLFRTEAYQGLAVGLGILRGMVDAHWEGLVPPPKRERARANAVEWLVSRVAPAIAAANPSDAEQTAVIAAYDALEDLDRLLGEKLQKEQVALGELFRALKPYRDDAKRAAEERIAEAARAAERAQNAAAESTADAAALAPTIAPAGATAGPPSVAADGDWAAYADRLPDMLRQTAAALRAASAADPRGYLLNRVGSWLRFDALPPEVGGRTMVFPPADEIAAVEAKAGAGEHADVIALAEELVWKAPFWLDAHRHTAAALEKLGQSMQPAADAIRSAVVMLVTRHPAILDLQFNDGRPFADAETRSWAAVTAGAGPSKNAADTAVAEAVKLLEAGQVRGAFDALGSALDGADGERERFLCQLAQARFCMDRGFVVMALSLLDHMDAVVAARDLESWEPDLALRVAELRYQAITHSDVSQMIDDTRRRTVVEQIRSRVARLDIGLASQFANS